MKTSSFQLYTGPGRISIARWAPRGHPAGFKIYRPLAPGEWSREPAGNGRSRFIQDPAAFAAGYAAQLAALDPSRVYADLIALAAPHEPVLLCWEVPPQPCHRRRVAAWFRDTLGINVAELPIGYSAALARACDA